MCSTLFLLFPPKQTPHGIQHTEDQHPGIGENGEPHVDEPQSPQHQADDLDADGEDDVLVHDAHAFPGDPDGFADFQRAVWNRPVS